jgi:hypothetical protein
LDEIAYREIYCTDLQPEHRILDFDLVRMHRIMDFGSQAGVLDDGFLMASRSGGSGTEISPGRE